VYPFSFAEFAESRGLVFPQTVIISPSIQRQFSTLWQEFCTRGGYPAVIFAKSTQEKITELGKILTRLVEKDMAFRLKKQELPAFEKVLQYVVRNICNLLKYEAIAQETGIRKKNAEEYIQFLIKSQILYTVYPFFQDKTKELTTHPKIYLSDIGLMTFLTKNYDLANDGRGIENTTFLELLKNKKYPHDEIKTYKKLNNSEIDFIYHYTSGDILPIEIKSGNETTIPKIFYSFNTEYPETKGYIKTTKAVSIIKQLGASEKKVVFSPNWNISNCL
jgi:predicted AAA+ superfamily ATPase